MDGQSNVVEVVPEDTLHYDISAIAIKDVPTGNGTQQRVHVLSGACSALPMVRIELIDNAVADNRRIKWPFAINATLNGVTCQSVDIQQNDPVDTIASKVKTMPRVLPADSQALFAREVQVVRVRAVFPAQLAYISGAFTLAFQGATSSQIPVTLASSAAMRVKVLEVIPDPRIEVSRIEYPSENAFEWRITFGANGKAPALILATSASTATASSSFTIGTAIVQSGLQASDVTLTLLYPPISLRVRDTKLADSTALSFTFHFWDVAPQFPHLKLVTSSLVSVTTQVPLHVSLSMVGGEINEKDNVSISRSVGQSGRFRIHVQGRSTAYVPVNADTTSLETAIRELNIDELSIAVQKKAGTSSSRLTSEAYDWILVASYPSQLTISVDDDEMQSPGLSVDVTRVSTGVETMVGYDNLAVVISTQDRKTRIMDQSVRVRVETADIRLTVRLPMSHVTVKRNESHVLADGIVLDGFNVEATLEIQCSDRGHVSLVSKTKRGLQYEATVMAPANMSKVALRGALSELNRVLEESHLMYSTRASSQRSAYGDEITFSLRSATATASQVIPVTVLAPLDAPVLLLSTTRVSVHEAQEFEIRGLKVNDGLQSDDLDYDFMQNSIQRRVRVHVHAGVGVNAALGQLRYVAVDLSHNTTKDELTFTTFAMEDDDDERGEADSTPFKTFRMRVQLTKRPATLHLTTNDRLLGDRDQLVASQDEAVSLSNFSIQIHGIPRSDNDIKDELRLNLSISAGHGTLALLNVSNETTQWEDLRTTSWEFRVATTLSHLNQVFKALEYIPKRNFNGPDQLMIRVKQATTTPASTQIMIEETTTIVLVFVYPMHRLPRWSWASSGSNITTLHVSTAKRFTLPAFSLHEYDHEDKVDDLDPSLSVANFFEIQMVLRATVRAATGTLVHNAVQTHQVINAEGEKGGSFVTLEGKVTNLRATLRQIQYQVSTSHQPLSQANDTVTITLEDISPRQHQFHSNKHSREVVAALQLDIDSSSMAGLTTRNILRKDEITTNEDKGVYVGDSFDFSAFEDYSSDLSIELYALHGSVYLSAAADTNSTASSDTETKTSIESPLKVEATDGNSLQRLLSRLFYTPNANFHGLDFILCRFHGSESELAVRIRPVNDEPIPKFIENFTNPWFRHPKLLLSALEVSDPDDDDIFEVRIDTTNGSLRWYRTPEELFDGVTISGVDTSRLQLKTTLKRLNALFAQPRLRFVPDNDLARGPPPTLHDQGTSLVASGAVRICVHDGAATPCEELVFPVQPFHSMRITSPPRAPKGETRKLAKGKPLQLSNVLHVHREYGEHDTDEEGDAVMLQIDTSSGYVVITDSDDAQVCADSYETRSELIPDGITRTVRASSVECLRSVLSSAVYVSSSLNSAESVRMLFQLFDSDLELLATVSLRVDLIENIPTSRFVVHKSASDVNNGTLAAALAHPRLASFAAIEIEQVTSSDADEDNDTTTANPPPGSLLDLNLTCGQCSFYYSKYIPGVSYEFAAQAASIVRFLGHQDGLAQVLQMLEVDLQATSTVRSQQDVVQLMLLPYDGDFEKEMMMPSRSRRSRAWNNTLVVPIEFTAKKILVEWRVLDAQLVYTDLEIDTAVPIHGVELRGRGSLQDDEPMQLTILVECVRGTSSLGFTVALRTQYQRCAPFETPIAIHTTRKDANRVLASIHITPNASEQVDLQYSVEVEGEHSGSTRISAPLLSVYFRLRDVDPVLVLAHPDSVWQGVEDEMIVLSDRIVLRRGGHCQAHENGDNEHDSDVFVVQLNVEHGTLAIPSHVCCVGVQTTHGQRGVAVVGAIATLQHAINALEYTGELNFAGNDTLHAVMTKNKDDGAATDTTSAPSSTLVSGPVHVPVVVQPQNDPPVIHYERPLSALRNSKFSLESVRITDIELVTDAGLSSMMRINVSSQTGSFTIDTMALDRVNQFETTSWNKSTGEFSRIVFQASLSDTNFLFQKTLFSPNGEGALSNLGRHQRIRVRKRPFRLAAAQLSLSKEHAFYDPIERHIAIAGPAILGAEESTASRSTPSSLRITGRCQFVINLEIQKVTIIVPHLRQQWLLSIWTPDGGTASLTGTFTLTLDLSFAGLAPTQRSATIYADAVAMQTQEVLGEMNNGRTIAESIEAKLLTLYDGLVSPQLKFHVDRVVAPSIASFTTEPAVQWKISIFHSPVMLPAPAVSTLDLVNAGSGASITMDSSVLGVPLGGSFRLQLGDEVTREIASDASDMDVQDALEALHDVEIAQITKPDVYTWIVTFFSPGENLPLLRGDAQNLVPGMQKSDTADEVVLRNGTRIHVTRLSTGKGQGNVFNVIVGATRVNPVYRVVTSANTSITGTFTLGFQDPQNANPLQFLATTRAISSNAVAMAEDEGVLQSFGARLGDSMQNALMLNFPLFVVVDSQKLGGTNAAVRLTQTAATNRVTGTFQLRYRSLVTDPIAADSSSDRVEAALNAILSQGEYTSTSSHLGRVIVRKARVDGPTRAGFGYAVLFTAEVSSPMKLSGGSNQLSLIADASQLLGIGAFANVEDVHVRTSTGSFELLTMNSLAMRWSGNIVTHLLPDALVLEGPAQSLTPAITSLVYRVPQHWDGIIQFRFDLEITPPTLNANARDTVTPAATARGEYLSHVMTSEVHLEPQQTPSANIEHSRKAAVVEATGGVLLRLNEFVIHAPEASRAAWFNLTLSCELGELSVTGNRSELARPTRCQSTWINGTLALIHTQLNSTVYVGSRESSEFDRFTLSLFFQGTKVIESVFLVRVQPPPVIPQVHIANSVEGLFTSTNWQVMDMEITHGDVVDISGIWIDNTNSGSLSSSSGDEITLKLRSEYGTLVFMHSHDYELVEASSLTSTSHRYSEDTSGGGRLSFTASLALLNQALERFQYRCAANYREHDTIQIDARNGNKDPPFIHSRTIRLWIHPKVVVPRVVLGSATYYTGYEDTGFQFPDLSLAIPDESATKDNATSTYASSSSHHYYQLWSTELLVPERKFLYPRAGNEDWRHRWIADFPVGGIAFFCEFGMSEELLPYGYGRNEWENVLRGVWLGRFVALTQGGDDDACPNGARNSSTRLDVLYVVAKSNVWDPRATYDCPAGYRWASTEEGSRYFPAVDPKSPSNLTEPYVFWSTCQWSGYTFGGVQRKYFRFTDSRVTGATKHAGRRDSAAVEVSFATTDFAGIVCLRNNRSNLDGLGRELWATDGTKDNVLRIADIWQGHGSSNPKYLTLFKSQNLLFQAETREFGIELFKTDGTAVGTVLAEDIWRGPRSSNPAFFAEWTAGDGRMYFAATSDSGRELWATDGFSSFTVERTRKTPGALFSGTTMVRDVCAGSGSSDPRFLTPTPLGVFFAADDCLNGRELWVTDGTAAGTRLVNDLNPTAGEGSNPSFLAWFSSKLYFQAQAAAATGFELYVSDGTASGTLLLADLVPGPLSSSPSYLSNLVVRDSLGAVVSGALYSSALDNDAHGKPNLWKSDGIKSGTLPLLDPLFLHQRKLRLDASTSRSETIFTYKNAMYYLMEALSQTSSSATEVATSASLSYQLHVRVNVGHINSVLESRNASLLAPAASINVTGSVAALSQVLSGLAYCPPPNWNYETGARRGHVVEWLDDLDSLHGSIHGDEDTWIQVHDLSFASVDDMAKITLQISLSATSGLLELSTTSGVTFLDETRNKRKLLTFKGTFANVNRSVSALRYLPDPNFNGVDQIVIAAATVDEYTRGESQETTATILVHIDAVNDPPVWDVSSADNVIVKPMSPTLIRGVHFEDADLTDAVCTTTESCTMDLVIEFSHGRLSLPRLFEELESSVQVILQKPGYIALEGTPDHLNFVLHDMVFQLEDIEATQQAFLDLNDIGLMLTVDDRGTFGKGGPRVSVTTLFLHLASGSTRGLSIIAPADKVLLMDEDTAYVFRDKILKIHDSDVAASPTASLLEMTVSSPHGAFSLQPVPGIQYVRNDLGTLVCRGFLAQINAALNSSAYIPTRDWYGSEKVTLSVVDTSRPSLRTASAVVFLAVAPVCDEPSWQSTRPRASEAFASLQEGEKLLINSLSLAIPDADADNREVAVSIVVNHGGVMLATYQVLLLTETQFNAPEQRVLSPLTQENAITESRLFSSKLEFRGRLHDVNSAFVGMIYEPGLHFHSDGNLVEEIVLMATSGCGKQEAPSTTSFMVRLRVEAVNDPPLLHSKGFTMVSSSQDSFERILECLPSEQFLEATEDVDLLLDPMFVQDPGQNPNSSFESDPQMMVNVSCVHCSIRPSMSLLTLRENHGLFITTTLTNATTTTGTREDMYQILVQGFQSTINTVFLSSLIFRSALNFYGTALALIQVSDLGNFGKGGEKTTTYAQAIAVKKVNDGPEIYLPPYGMLEPLVQLDEDSVVLLRGAPSFQELSSPVGSKSTGTTTKKWNLMLAQPFAPESSTRLRSLAEFPGSEFSVASYFAQLQNKILFRGRTPQTGDELWQSDGTAAGTTLLKDIYPSGQGSKPSFLTTFSVDNRVYFAAQEPDLSWRILEDHRDSYQSFRQSAFDSRVFFAVSESNVWDPNQIYDCPLGYHWMTTAEASIVFIGTVANDGHDNEPAVYFDQCGWDGYTWGGVTRMHFRFSDSRVSGAYKHAGYRDSYRLDTGFQTDSFAGIVCYRDQHAHDQIWGPELWVTDGSSGGTRPKYFVEYKRLLYFQATSSDFGAELWMTDGSRAGTLLVADIEPGIRSSEPKFLSMFAGLLFFSASTSAAGRELWFSDGVRRTDNTENHSHVGTGILRDICAGPKSSNPKYFTALGTSAVLLFQADDCVKGAELWRTDGTFAGTRIVADINAGSAGSCPSYLTFYSTKVYIQANDGIHGTELWSTDGTAAGTLLHADLAPGISSSKPSFLTVLSLGQSSQLAFAAQAERDRQWEFWQSDGTLAGTIKVFLGSREVAYINTNTMDTIASPRFPSLSSKSFFYFGKQQADQVRTNAALSQDSASTRSITLFDVESSTKDLDRDFILHLNCSKGYLSLNRGCNVLTFVRGNQSESALMTVQGSLRSLNCAVEKVAYHAKPDASGWDDIFITLEQRTDNELLDDDGRLYSTTKRILIEIRSINDASIIQMPKTYFALLDAWIQLANIAVSDADAGDGLVYIQLKVHNGILRVGRSAERIVQLRKTADSVDAVGSTLEFAATISDAVLVFQDLEYKCLIQMDCRDGMRDYLTIYVDDNGFTGSGGAQTSTNSAVIQIQSGA
ncbi:hypothetical protein FI667_g17529, partial [Globisporangium splendens]